MLLAPLLLVSKGALAADNPIAGRSASVKASILIKGLHKGTFAIPDSPASASLNVFDTLGTAGNNIYDLPVAQWTGLGTPAGSKGWKYKGSGSPTDPCAVVLIKSSVIKYVCKGTGVTITLPFAGDLGVVLNVGNQRYCAAFGGTTIKTDGNLLKRKDAPPPPACPTPGSRVRFVFPASGERVDGAIALAANEENALPIEQLDRVRFEYSPDGVNVFPIADIAADERYFETVWDTTEAGRGTYQVRVTLTDTSGGTSTDLITILVNDQPDPSLQVVCVDATTLVFDGSASSDPDGIDRYIWDFGDGESADGDVVEHRYVAPGVYYPQLTVVDAYGAFGVHHFGINTTNCMGQLKGCDPKSMKIETANPPGASWNMHWIKAAADKKKLGTYYSRNVNDWRTAAAAATFQFVANFEVVVELEPNSDPSKCEEGQRVQRTSMHGAKVVKKKGPKAGAEPHDPPAGGEVQCEYNDPDGDWCDDDYRKEHAVAIRALADAKEGWVKVHVAQSEIRWLDGPGTGAVSKRLIQAAGGYKYMAKFEASVKGDTRTVKCTWEVFLGAHGDARTVTVEITGVALVICS